MTSLRSVGAPPLDLLDESTIALRVWPSDLDAFGHMNNGRFLTIMDLGRNDLIVRSGAVWQWLKRRWSPVLGGATIRYRRPLRAFNSYQLRTRLLCWDDKWFYFRQRFTRGDDLHALALVKGLLQGPKGKVPPSEIPAAIGRSGHSPPIPEAVARWNEVEEEILGYRGNS